ncbi:hypothetical protein GCM10020331_059670 [Ectobacillus funiculus]
MNFFIKIIYIVNKKKVTPKKGFFKDLFGVTFLSKIVGDAFFTTFNPFFGYKKYLNKVMFIRRFEIMGNTFPKIL